MRPILPRVVPFAVFVAILALGPGLDRLTSSIGLDARWWYAMRVAVVAGVLLWYWKRYAELGSGRALRFTDWMLTAAVGAAVFVFWINLDFNPLAVGGASGYDPRAPQGGIDWGLAATRLTGAVAVVPIMEELFWRSFLLRWIKNPQFLKVAPAQVGAKALAISAVLFGLEHHLWFAGILAGLAYGWLYMRTGNLWAPVVAHGATNAILGVWVLETGSWQFW
jgi:uncharacterized protein